MKANGTVLYQCPLPVGGSALPRQLFARILGRIARLCQACAWG
jgi:hypothetical protein